MSEHPALPRRSDARKRVEVRDAVSALCGADYELACAVTKLDAGGHPDALEAETLFQAVLAFRQKIEAEING